MQFDPFC